MPSEPDLALTSMILRALVYALAIAVLVLWFPEQGHVFIYQGF